MPQTDAQTKALTTAGLNLIAQALSIYDHNLRLAVSNQRFREMFDLPDRLVQPGARFDDTIRHMAQYQFEGGWPVKEFVRGTLRLNGWAAAWADVFAEVETLSGPEGDARLKEMSDQFWAENAYDPGEPDRVVLCVGLKAEKDGVSVCHKTYVMDAWGDENGTAMAYITLQQDSKRASKQPNGQDADETGKTDHHWI